MRPNKEKIYQVSEFNQLIYDYLKKLGDVIVEGEIFEKSVRGQWVSIRLKDSNSSISVFGTIYKIKNFKEFEEGMKVKVYGKPFLQRKFGNFSIFANQIIPAGIGSLKLMLEKIKFKLEKEGLFDKDRKRSIPLFPEKIGLITAKNSEAYSDFIKVLKHRMGGIKIYFYPVNVQGKDSVKSILAAFKYFNKQMPDLDLLAITRGGGSLEDLISFNDEQVARAVFASKVPVVSGIGHENDFTLVDYVADIRASTPSNTAELIVRNKSDVLQDINYKISRIEQKIKETIWGRKNTINIAINILGKELTRKVENLKNLIRKFTFKFNNFVISIEKKTDTVVNSRLKLIKDIDYLVKNNKLKLDQLLRLLNNLDYKQVLKRGYSITIDSNGKIVKLIKSIDKGDSIKTQIFDGNIYSKVFTKEKK